MQKNMIKASFFRFSILVYFHFFFKIIAQFVPRLAIILNGKLTQLIYYPGRTSKMDPNSEDYVYFIKNVFGKHLDQLMLKHRDAYLFPEVLDGHVAEIDMVEEDLQRLKEMFEAKHKHMIATRERRREFQEECSILRLDLANEKKATATLMQKDVDQTAKIAELERELVAAHASIAADMQKHNRLETELKKKADERVAEAEQRLESMRELLSLERQKFEALQRCPPAPPPAPPRRESMHGSMVEIMDEFQIVMQGCTTLISQQASHYFGSMRSAPDYTDVSMYEGRFMREVNALGTSVGAFCKEMGCLPLYGEVDVSVNFAL